VFARLGRWCHDHPWKVVGLWVAAIVVANMALAGAGGAQTNADFSLPDVESQKATEILEDNFGGQGAGFGGAIVFKSDVGVDAPDVREGMESLFAKIGKVHGVSHVGSPYDEGGERQIATKAPYAGQIAFAQVDFDPELGESDFTQVGTDVRKLLDEARDDLPGVQIEANSTFAEQEAPTTEALGVAFAIFILILAFGSVLAMGLPIGVALAGIFAGTTIAGLLSFVVNPPSFAAIFGVMIGLGVGIDYALFIVTRYRENLHKGHDSATSTAIALDTAGRAVIFAGTTVVISMLGMLLMRLSFITGMAIAIATVVAATMVASITLLPALLGFAKQKIEVTRWGGLITAGAVAVFLIGAGLGFAPLVLLGLFATVALIATMLIAYFIEKGKAEPSFPLNRQVPPRKTPELRQTLAYRWSRVIQHRPWPAAIGSAVVLLLLAIPIFSLNLGFSDDGNFPDDTSTRKAYDLRVDGFGPGYNGSFVLASETPDGVSDADLNKIADAVRDTEGIDFVGEPFPSDNGKAVLWEAFPTTSPQDEKTQDLLKTLRDDVLPAAEQGTGLDVSVGGTVAVSSDFAHYLSSRLPYFLGAVLILSFLLLMVVFRSLLVPLKAVIMNLLSIGAAYGVMVAGFQWGWLGGILNFESAPIEPWMPMMLFAIVFGLSMDYEVFLLSRVKEEWLRTGDSHTSVADGLAATARVITAAALIMVFVFGAFLLEPDRIVKLMGTGLATAVLLDATIVRMLLVPATMELLGDKNWWMPKWLDRILPNVDVEGHAQEGLSPEGDPERQLEPTS
jgi:RND superfamily putative drug exporter